MIEFVEIKEFNETIKFVEFKEIKLATYGDLKRLDYSLDFMGVEKIETNGEIFYTSLDFEGKKQWADIENMIITDFYCLNYYNGQNHITDIFEALTTIDASIKQLEIIEPAYSFDFELTKKSGEKFIVTQSNVSGYISPYYYIKNSDTPF